MINIKNIFRKEQKIDDTIASIWFGAAVPFGMAMAVTVSWAASWLDVSLLDWLFADRGSRFCDFGGGRLDIPSYWGNSGNSRVKVSRNAAVASMVLSASELLFLWGGHGEYFFEQQHLS